ncbi:hypothetical protein Tco_0842552 [Tanacetum coccineum]|uniref:Uncharacterized protein n=1 Tax=Tanacetum coccineum TaxID=301880 RepID=A0ABQ5AZL0_9ASTR
MLKKLEPGVDPEIVRELWSLIPSLICTSIPPSLPPRTGDFVRDSLPEALDINAHRSLFRVFIKLSNRGTDFSLRIRNGGQRPLASKSPPREKKEKQNLAKAKAKHAEEGGSVAPRKKRPEPQTAEVEKDVVDLSEGTRLPTPQTNVIHPSTHTNHGGTQDNVVFSDAHSFHSAHNEDTGEDAAAHRFVSGQCHSSCSDREKELLGQLRDMEMRRMTRGRLPWSKLRRSKTQLEMDYQKLVCEFIPEVVKKLHMSVKYRQSLAVPISLCFIAGWLGSLSMGKMQDQIAVILSKTWKAKHRELFTKQYPFIQKVVASYRLLMDSLLEISPDVPSSATDNDTGPSTINDGDGAV